MDVFKNKYREFWRDIYTFHRDSHGVKSDDNWEIVLCHHRQLLSKYKHLGKLATMATDAVMAELEE